MGSSENPDDGFTEEQLSRAERAFRLAGVNRIRRFNRTAEDYAEEDEDLGSTLAVIPLLIAAIAVLTADKAKELIKATTEKNWKRVKKLLNI